MRAGNVFESQPNAKFWAGERYYRRQHIEINDFYPLDMSGYGAGFEDLKLGVGKLAVGYLAGARPDIQTADGNYVKNNIDVRFYDVKAPGGTLAGWFDFATGKGGTDVRWRSYSHQQRLRIRNTPSTTRVAWRISRFWHSVRHRSGQQLQHVD